MSDVLSLQTGKPSALLIEVFYGKAAKMTHQRLTGVKLP